MADLRRTIRWGRIRVPLALSGALLIVVATFVDAVPAWPAWIVYAVGMALYIRLGSPPQRAPVEVVPPVEGRWRAFNSPADKVPSHGLHAYGQTYAIDIVQEPEPDARPATGWWPLARHPTEFPGFGEPVRAPVAGRVVKVHNRERDHWSRNSWPAIGYMVVESIAREVMGLGRIFGNHIVIDGGGDLYAVLAHLRQGSITVDEGDNVDAGQIIAQCGNSGNSSEPHVHFQLMDAPSAVFADGIPFRFAAHTVDGTFEGGVPGKEDAFDAHPASHQTGIGGRPPRRHRSHQQGDR